MNNRLFALGRLKAGELNKTESAYRDRLESLKHAGEIADYWFEGMKLRLADNTFYTGDFLVQLPTGELEIHEVKGARAVFMDDAKVKIKVANERFPFVFRVAFPRPKRDGGGWDIERVGNVPAND